MGVAIGEDAAVIDMGDHYLVAATDPVTFATVIFVADMRQTLLADFAKDSLDVCFKFFDLSLKPFIIKSGSNHIVPAPTLFMFYLAQTL